MGCADDCPARRYVRYGAELSDCGQYRYLLWRVWDERTRPLVWIMLNPSTADALRDDATIRVCAGRAKRLGYGGIAVANLFALRSTDPQALYTHPSPLSEPGQPGRNVRTITRLASPPNATIVCAWGTHGTRTTCGPKMVEWLRHLGVRPMALKINADGSPAHPLRIPYSQPLIELEAPK
jgi:hypothetical protein